LSEHSNAIVVSSNRQSVAWQADCFACASCRDFATAQLRWTLDAALLDTIQFSERQNVMLYYAAVFLVIALKILFFVFLVFAAATFILSLLRRT
jgi:hypothetical protein